MQEVVIPIILFACFVFYQLRTAETNTLLAIIIMTVFVTGAYWYFYKGTAAIDDDNLAARREVTSTLYPIAKVPANPKRRLQHLKHNQTLQEIAADLKFIKIFDQARLGDLLISMDHFQKIYMYILAGRYRPESYISTFMDLRTSVLETLYSLIHIVPETLKHTYGFQPHDVVQRNIDAFTALSRRMLTVLISYSKANGYTVPDHAISYYHPYEPTRTNILP
jgi:hypothetical protein